MSKKSAKNSKASRLLDNYVEIPVDKLVLADWNYKKTDDKKSLALMEKLKANLVKNRQIENLIIREAPTKGYFEVVNGNHRLMALKEIGEDSAVCYNLGNITQTHAERIALETNETKFDSDPTKLAELIKHISGDFDIEDLASTLSYDENELESMTKLLDFDWDKSFDSDGSEDEGDPESVSDTEFSDDEWKTIELRLPSTVADLFLGQVDRFKRLLNPEEMKLETVSIVQPIEAISATLMNIPDKELP